MMLPTLVAIAFLSVAPVHNMKASPAPAPTATPLKEIVHVIARPICTALRRSIGPAVGHVLQNDKIIAASKPLFVDYARDHATSGGNQAAEDMDIMHLENFVRPMVNNVSEIKRILNEPGAFPRFAHSEQEKQVLLMRAQLLAVLADQEKALDLVSGLVDTQQLGQLQAGGNELAKSMSAPDVKTVGSGPQPAAKPNPVPTTNPSDLLNAGLPDKSRATDPRFQNTDSVVGHNPLYAFAQQVAVIQRSIDTNEGVAAKSIIAAVTQCGGHLPGQASPSPAPSPTATP